MTPIIFIHYGDINYLKYSLESAVLFNPDKKVILLGDQFNEHYNALGVEHYYFDDYSEGREIGLFNDVYQFIAGTQHKREEWTRFVFRRWFIIYNFITARNIHQFWTFDSDTLILTDLSKQEAKFAGYDCTEQCCGICMNGFITNQAVVKGYIDKMNELFQRPSFLSKQKDSMKRSPKYAFTEMRAYVEFRDESKIKRVRLSRIIDGETFLDSICTIREHRLYLEDEDYEVYSEPLCGYQMKKMFMCSDGNILAWNRSSKQLIRLNSINMSWVPSALLGSFLSHARHKLKRTRFWFLPPQTFLFDLRGFKKQFNLTYSK